MGKPLFKASEGNWFDILREWEDATDIELQQGSGTQVLIRFKVCPEAFPTSSLMSIG